MPNKMMPGGVFGMPLAASRMFANAPRLQQEDEEKKRQGYWQGGDKFTGRDALAAGLAAIGDGFSSWANGPSAAGATRMLVGGRFNALDEAKKAKAAAEAAAAAERQRQRERGEGLQDYRTKKEIDRELSPPESSTFTDKFGNRWQAGPDGGPVGDKPVFVENRPFVYIQGDRVVTIDNPYATGGGGAPQAPVGRLQMDKARPFNEGQTAPQQMGARPNAMTNPAAPITNARMITQQQFDDQLRKFGGDMVSMTAWMNANNVSVGGN